MPAIQSAVVMAPANTRHVAPLREVRQIARFGHISPSALSHEGSVHLQHWQTSFLYVGKHKFSVFKQDDFTPVTADAEIFLRIYHGRPLEVVLSPQTSHLADSFSRFRQ